MAALADLFALSNTERSLLGKAGTGLRDTAQTQNVTRSENNEYLRKQASDRIPADKEERRDKEMAK